MKPEKNFESPAGMQAVTVLFDQWRSTRRKRGRIPESLWEAAADLSPSERGAWVGDFFMSFLHTCNLMKINAFECITILLRNADKLAADPGRWMPWNYRQTLSEVPP